MRRRRCTVVVAVVVVVVVVTITHIFPLSLVLAWEGLRQLIQFSTKQLR